MTIQYGLSSVGVYIVGLHIAKRFVMATLFGATNKPPDLLAKVTGILDTIRVAVHCLADTCRLFVEDPSVALIDGQR